MLRLRTYKFQIITALKLSDKVASTNFAVDMLERIDASPDFLRQVGFSDEATFHISAVVNMYSCRILSGKIHMSPVSWREGAPK
jgi:uncharacterized membrane protein YkvA (DUF1232 family)